MARPLFGLTESAQMRAELAATYDSTCSVKRPGAFVDEGGGTGYYQPGTTLSFDCRLTPASDGTETEIAAQPAIVELVRISYDLDGPVLLASDQPVVDGVQYEVVAVRPMGTHAMERHATLRIARASNG